MLETVAPLVLPGGSLTYSVCTFDRLECEAVIEGFLRAHPMFRIEQGSERARAADSASPVASSVPWGVLTDAGGLVRTWPHRHDADAFFAVRLRADAASVR
jgi:16S rRNA (cytosine967-C5)-methyltransferase